MLDEKNRTFQTHPSLLPLRMALTLAESRSPARPRRVDTNERLAMQLIARMQSRYKKTNPFLSPSERFRSLVVKHAR
jgi:hypothetical protein